MNNFEDTVTENTTGRCNRYLLHLNCHQLLFKLITRDCYLVLVGSNC